MVRITRVHTGTGDDGTTGLVDGSRRSKGDLRLEAVDHEATPERLRLCTKMMFLTSIMKYYSWIVGNHELKYCC